MFNFNTSFFLFQFKIVYVKIDLTKKREWEFFMENNSLSPSPVPTPEPGTSMPEFAAAPAQPTQPLAPASSMPDFGTQPVPPMPPMDPTAGMPMPAEAPVETPAPEPVVETPVETTPTEEAPAASDLGEIMNAGVAAAEPQAQPEIQTPTEEVSTSPISDLLAKQQAPAETPAAETKTQPTDAKKPSAKLIALIAAAALLVIGCVVATILLLSKPKQPASNPSDAPQQTVANDTVDTSVEFDKLTSEQALEFLQAVNSDNEGTFFPDDYTDEEVRELIDGENVGIFYSYEKKADILKIAKESEYVAKFKDKITEDTAEVTEKDGYAIVKFDADATGCDRNCTAFIFDQKVVNFYAAPTTDVLTGVQGVIVHIMIIDHTKTNVEKVAPLIASVFMSKQNIYSTELKEANGEFEYIVNTIEYKDSNKEKAVKKTIHFKVIATGEFLYMPDLTTETVL